MILTRLKVLFLQLGYVTQIESLIEINSKLLKSTLLVPSAAMRRCFHVGSFVRESTTVNILRVLFFHVAHSEAIVSRLTLTSDLFEIDATIRLLILASDLIGFLTGIGINAVLNLCLLVRAHELKLEVFKFGLHLLFHVEIFSIAVEGSLKSRMLLAVEHLFIARAVLVGIREFSSVSLIPLCLLFALLAAESRLFLRSTHRDLFEVNAELVAARSELLRIGHVRHLHTHVIASGLQVRLESLSFVDLR
mmetsp:Transcript_28519/g.38034  ORF Transcript_28519/g.38034 Transcript_28519/m.38034 type:complete len:249 (-) Transcript_28519:69-815(-)